MQAGFPVDVYPLVQTYMHRQKAGLQLRTQRMVGLGSIPVSSFCMVSFKGLVIACN